MAQRRLGMGRMLRRSMVHRRARTLSALVGLTVSAAVTTALLTLYADLDAKLHRTFREFGANVVVSSTHPRPEMLRQGEQAAGPGATVAEFAYAVATTDRGTPVVVAGVEFPSVRRLDSWWQLAAWPTGANEALLGARAAEFVNDEKAVSLTFAGHTATFAGAGRVRTGGDEDSRIYVPLPAFEAWTGVAPSVLEIQVPGDSAAVEAAIARLRKQLPTEQVEPVRALVEGESRIVDRTHALMFGAVLLIALTVSVSVLATLSASVLERRRDFALMKALGGSEGQMMSLFLMETLVLALVGVIAGWLLGSVAAYVISVLNFGTATLPRLRVLPAVLLLNVLIAAAAALFPVRSLRGLEPAALLKGE